MTESKLITLPIENVILVVLPEGAETPRIETNQSIIPYGQDLCWYRNGGDKSYGMDETEWVTLPPGNWRIIGMLSEVREEQAAELVEKGADNWGNEFGYHDYLGMFHNVRTALESLDSAILSAGWFFSNPYVSHPDTWDYLFEAMHKKEEDVQNWETAQSRVLCRERCLLLGREGE